MYLFIFLFLVQLSREGTLKVGDRIVSVDGISYANFSHIEAVNALKMANRDALFRIEYDVSIMGEYD